MANGNGRNVGSAISSHSDVAVVSFTGSTRAGVGVALAAAPTVKHVTQELGGKSVNIVFDDADLENAVEEGAQAYFRNTGQSYSAPTRMLVPRSKMAEAAAAASRQQQPPRSVTHSQKALALAPSRAKLSSKSAALDKSRH
jgi:aldehyde dehydrogenase (NAD+)